MAKREFKSNQARVREIVRLLKRVPNFQFGTYVDLGTEEPMYLKINDGGQDLYLSTEVGDSSTKEYLRFLANTEVSEVWTSALDAVLDALASERSGVESFLNTIVNGIVKGLKPGKKIKADDAE